MKPALIAFFLPLVLLRTPVVAQERGERYFVTYDHYMEEPDALDIGVVPTLGRADDVNTFVGYWTEFEYGARKWWTSEFYIDWQHTQHEGHFFTGFRFENRFRPFLETRRINPILYVEYEHLNEADKTLKEIVGFDSKKDLEEPSSETRHEHEREIETKLILSSDIGLWNVSENLIGAKNLHGGLWEFGYSLGVSRLLAAPTGNRCTLCAERFAAGVELYGGLGEWGKFTVRGTSQYIAPLLAWTLPSETTIRVSPGWGLTDQSVRSLIRIGVSQEIDGFGRSIGKLFGKH
jgi:hypothetical protein